MTRKKVRAAIVGASGYTGAELVRLLARHPDVGIVALTADRKAGQGMGHVFPHLAAAVDELHLPDLSTIEAVDWSGVDVAFCGLPHGTTQATVASLPDNVKVIDLSADFRLFDVDAYSQWYGHSHCAPALQAEAVYGITELARERMAGARLIANPGCYPTAVVLPLAPALAAGVVEVEDIIIDAKSGVTGAGRAAKETSLFAEVAEGIHAYGVASHRHTPEIEQALSWAAGQPVAVSFTPQLMPMNRGILASIYVRLSPHRTVEDLRRVLDERYRNEPFVRVVPEGSVPGTRHVRGSNFCLIGIYADRLPGRAIILSVIDNLVKGASGQAVQNMNVLFELPESQGLGQQPLFP